MISEMLKVTSHEVTCRAGTPVISDHAAAMSYLLSLVLVTDANARRKPLCA